MVEGATECYGPLRPSRFANFLAAFDIFRPQINANASKRQCDAEGQWVAWAS